MMDTLRNTMSYRPVSISYGNHSESGLMIFGCVGRSVFSKIAWKRAICNYVIVSKNPVAGTLACALNTRLRADRESGNIAYNA